MNPTSKHNGTLATLMLNLDAAKGFSIFAETLGAQNIMRKNTYQLLDKIIMQATKVKSRISNFAVSEGWTNKHADAENGPNFILVPLAVFASVIILSMLLMYSWTNKNKCLRRSPRKVPLFKKKYSGKEAPKEPHITHVINTPQHTYSSRRLGGHLKESIFQGLKTYGTIENFI